MNTAIGILTTALILALGLPFAVNHIQNQAELERENQELTRELEQTKTYLEGYKDGNTEN